MYQPFVAPGDLVFDVGAHLGDRTAAFSALGCRVVALEPHPELEPWLRRLTRRRGDVTVLAVAAGAEPGRAELAFSPANPTVSSMSRSWRERVRESNPGFNRVRWTGLRLVEVTTLDQLIARYGRPAFCKIDVEGYEARVLAGLSQPLPGLSVEFVSGALDECRACVDRLESLGEYVFNAVAGESRSWRWAEWRPAPAVRDWLDAGAEGLTSGDLYARQVGAQQAPPGVQQP